MARLVGEVVAVDWDENDEPVEVALETDGERYAVFHDHGHEELLGHVGHEVEVEGVIEENESGEPIVKIRRVDVLELMAEDECEEYGDGEEEEIPDPEW